MTAQVHRRRVGDIRTVLSVTLQQPNESGVAAAINHSGKTIQFKMVNAATNAVKIAATGTGLTVVAAANGTVNYAFSSGGVDAAGVYWGSFIVTESGNTDHVPVKQSDLKIVIDSDTQTGEEAYEEAVV